MRYFPPSKAATTARPSGSGRRTSRRPSCRTANPQQRAFIDTFDPNKAGKYEGSVGGQEARKAQPGSRELGDPVERFAEPLIVSEAPADIGLSSPASSLAFAGRHLHATTQEDLHVAAAHTLAAAVGRSASWFAHAGGIKSIAAAGSHTLQAHTDAMEILADESVTVTSSNGEIHLMAQDKIVLQAGQSSVTLEGANITFACPGTFSVKGAGNAFEGPGRVPAKVDDLPTGLVGREPNWLDLELRGWEAQPIKHTRYLVTFADGSTRRGTLDANGYAHLEDVPEGGEHTVEYENPDISRDPEPYSFDDLKASIKAFIGA